MTEPAVDAPVGPEQVAGRYSRGATVAAVVIALCWHAGFDLPSTAGGWGQYRWPWAVAAAWAVYVVVGAVGGYMLLRRIRSAATAWVLAATALAVSVTVVAACRPEAVDTPANWATGSVGWLAVIVLWFRPARELVAFLLVNALVMLSALVVEQALTPVAFARFSMAVLGSVTLQLGYSISTHSFDIAAGWAVASSAQTAQAMARRAAIEAVALARAERQEALRLVSAQLLADLAAGADPADPALRHRCAVGAARLRRLLAETDDVPDPFLHELRACADVAERRGVLVAMVAVGALPDLPLPVRRVLMDSPIEVLSAAATNARVTVVGGDDAVVVSVIADAPELALTTHPDIGTATYRQGNLLWIETRWPAESPSPSSKTSP
ncbi:hypothetical protein AB0J72_19010 [Dactylosporangium sp. NPDC049742]|uniref:hypothetical protein n=1 Tax=Dactylosporangium sp. NPDC049742 TaxID=3154737 RepID=UPI003432877E